MRGMRETIIQVAGTDRVGFMHNMTTADVKRLAVGTACPAAIVNQKGQVLDWGTLHAEPDALFFVTGPGRGDATLAWLERYLITEDVQLSDATAEAARYLPAPLTAYERVLAGMPAFGHELTERTNPWEARLDAAVSLHKGCYLGQEVVARLRAYDKVQRLLVGLEVLEGVCRAGDALHVEGEERAIGEVTSVIEGQPTAVLGFVKRAHAVPGRQVHGVDGKFFATVVDRPFWQHHAEERPPA